jgi:RimJ/RimL family protein N-acetyltransferase
VGSVPFFETQRLFLKPPEHTHLSAYSQNFVDDEVLRFLSNRVPWPYPEKGVWDYFNTQIFPEQGKNRWLWALYLKEDPESPIGAVELWRKTTPECPENRGFWLARRFWGQGLMTEALVPITDYAFDVLGFESLTFANAVGNARSRRIKEKQGAHFLGVCPGSFVDPTLTEQEVWRLDSQAWRETRSLKMGPR